MFRDSGAPDGDLHGALEYRFVKVVPASLARVAAEPGRLTDIGGGLFQSESFFDVFVELSLDGGASFIPQRDGPSRVTLVPAPASLLLLGLGAAGLLGRRLLRRKPEA